MKISAIMYKPQWADAEYPTLAIDDIPLEVWLYTHTQETNSDNLVPAQSWLHNEQEIKLAWERLYNWGSGIKIIVPLLICPDDIDFGCTVVVTEQETTSEFVFWHRFGFSLNKDITNEVYWFKNTHLVRFDIFNFKSAVADLWSLCEKG